MVINCRILIILLTILVSLNPISNFIQYTYFAIVNPAKAPSAVTGLRVQRYLEIGNILYSLLPNDNLLTSEIGGLGYSFRGEIIDGVGLVSPEALKYHPMKVPQQRSSGGIGAIPAKMVGDLKPEIIVSYPIFVQEFDKSAYCSQYKKIILPALSKYWQDQSGIEKIWGSPYLFVYIRKDIFTNQLANEIRNRIGSEIISIK